MPPTLARDFAPKFWQAILTDGAVVPSDPPWWHASGTNPYRVLLVGGTAAVGYGLTTHEHSVGGQFTALLASTTGCGAETDIVASPGMTIDSAVEEVLRRDLSRYAAVVLVLDAAVAVAAPARLRPAAQRVLAAGVSGLPSPLPLVVAVAPALAAELCGSPARPPRPQRMAVVEQALEALGGTPRARGLLLEMPGEQDARAVYERWARSIAFAVAPRLAGWDKPHAAKEIVEPERREAALQRLGVLDGSLADEFRRIVEYTRLAYGTRSAALSIFTEGTTWFMTRRGVDVERLPEGETVCTEVAAEPAGLIIGDVRLDRRLREREAVRAGGVAFYAGYRIESPDGQPIGTLCVFDPQPRTTGPDDLGLLRDFALAAQRKLWSLTVRRAIAR